MLKITRLPAHIDINDIFKPIDKELALVKRTISDQLITIHCDERIKKLVSSFNINSGKMLRPGLVILSGNCCGKITKLHIQIAAIIELLHNATLLHDDVIDEGQIRRGMATVNNLYGNDAAVLLGDLFLSRVFRMCTELEPEIIKTISTTTARVCKGELRQTINKKNWNLSEKEYIDIITEKSAALFSTCCYLGGCLSGANRKQIRSLSDFGLNFGIAFQIADDLVDIIGDVKKSGKTLCKDVNKKKPTLALIHLLKHLSKKEKNKLIKEMNAENTNTKKIKDALASSGSIKYTHNKIQKFINKAIISISDFRNNKAQKALIKTAGFLSQLINQQ